MPGGGGTAVPGGEELECHHNNDSLKNDEFKQEKVKHPPLVPPRETPVETVCVPDCPESTTGFPALDRELVRKIQSIGTGKPNAADEFFSLMSVAYSRLDIQPTELQDALQLAVDEVEKGKRPADDLKFALMTAISPPRDNVASVFAFCLHMTRKTQKSSSKGVA